MVFFFSLALLNFTYFYYYLEASAVISRFRRWLFRSTGRCYLLYRLLSHSQFANSNSNGRPLFNIFVVSIIVGILRLLTWYTSHFHSAYVCTYVQRKYLNISTCKTRALLRSWLWGRLNKFKFTPVLYSLCIWSNRPHQRPDQTPLDLETSNLDVICVFPTFVHIFSAQRDKLSAWFVLPMVAYSSISKVLLTLLEIPFVSVRFPAGAGPAKAEIDISAAWSNINLVCAPNGCLFKYLKSTFNTSRNSIRERSFSRRRRAHVLKT